MKRQQIYSMITLVVFTVEDCSFIPDASVVFDRNILGEGLSEIEITTDMVETKLCRPKLNNIINTCPG